MAIHGIGSDLIRVSRLAAVLGRDKRAAERIRTYWTERLAALGKVLGRTEL